MKQYSDEIQIKAFRRSLGDYKVENYKKTYALKSDIQSKISDFNHLMDMVFTDKSSDTSTIRLNNLIGGLIIDFKEIVSLLYIHSSNADYNWYEFAEYTDRLEKEVADYRNRMSYISLRQIK